MVFAPSVDACPATAEAPAKRQNEIMAAAGIFIVQILPDLTVPIGTGCRPCEAIL
jgi:hypothetical protein